MGRTIKAQVLATGTADAQHGVVDVNTNLDGVTVGVTTGTMCVGRCAEHARRRRFAGKGEAVVSRKLAHARALSTWWWWWWWWSPRRGAPLRFQGGARMLTWQGGLFRAARIRGRCCALGAAISTLCS